ncbi:phage head spike fiber domain-containing protein [Endozoicomonas lisbonensis]|uniref:LamG-like jellyroll fold domain-containing protein n=1 Tax=Endozoicomonas lisbonensis TaxID=3120522 RepID=A0ABV2SPC1_9GAMM
MQDQTPAGHSIPSGTVPALPDYMQDLVDATAALIARFNSEYDALATAVKDLNYHVDNHQEYAVPHPDVWLPLTSDIHLKEGFGFTEFTRASKATYINKSGVLTLAEEHEPRFEREGILIEGQSTNLLENSTEPRVHNGSELVAYTEKLLLNNPAPIMEKRDNSQSNIIAGSVIYRGIKSNTKYSITAFIDLDNTSIDLGAIRLQFGFSGNWLNKYVVYDLETEEILLATVEAYDVVKIKNNILCITATQTSLESSEDRGSIDIYATDRNNPSGGTSATIGDHVAAFCYQFEELPFPSSYIPTEGEPATRVTDQLSVTYANNVPNYLGDFTISHCSSLLGYTSNSFSRPVSWRAPITGLTYTSSGAKSFIWGQNNRTPISFDNTQEHRFTLSVGSSKARLALDGDIKVESSYLPEGNYAPAYLDIGRGVSSMFGHVRGVKIWHQALNAKQIKSIA